MTETTPLVGQWRRVSATRNRHYVITETETFYVTACRYGWDGQIGKRAAWGLVTDDEPDKPKCPACCKATGETAPPVVNPPLKGHGLACNGAPHTADGSVIYRDERHAQHGWTSPGGAGRAKCQCGVLSEDLPSAAARRRWHVSHKAEIKEASS